MKIREIESWQQPVKLSRPYSIATRSIDSVDLFFVRVVADNGLIGFGSASPAEGVTGESVERCSQALAVANLEWLRGGDPSRIGTHCNRLAEIMSATPAARLAVETALHDLLCKHLDVALVDYLGRCHTSLPTSITLGIKPTIDEALEEVDEYLARGFVCLKVKIGNDLAADLELLGRIRERCGPDIAIRVDANRGYTLEETANLWPTLERLGIELVEQPVELADFERLSSLATERQQIVAADESLVNEHDAMQLIRPPQSCGIFNIKLMKCGGLTSALRIAALARLANIELMWGCMDESVVSIAAALHAAYACPNTRYLDLDGSLDLPKDPARGGFRIDQGRMHLTDRPGLGVTWET